MERSFTTEIKNSTGKNSFKAVIQLSHIFFSSKNDWHVLVPAFGSADNNCSVLENETYHSAV